jgi:ABC-type sugar transport system substrate-binding protein/DNA-binding response OmpR family regulator/nitrogen-specific signal transduction histidine kinase
MKTTTNNILLCGILLGFLLASCKQTATEYTIGVSQCSDDEWRHKMNTEMQHEAVLHQRVVLDIKTVGDDTEKQIIDIEEFIDKKVDLIVVAPNKAAPITPVIEKAYAAGIPVVLVDRKILSDKYTAFIGADNFQIGKEVGNYVVKRLEGKGRIAEIHGLEGSTPSAERHQGFMSVINDYPDIQVVYETDGAWLMDVAEAKVEEALAAAPDINLIFAHNDRMAIGAYQAANKQRRADSIYFIGIDALPGQGGGIEQVLQNKLEATFIYPTSGEKIIQLALAILQGQPYEKTNTLYTNVVDKTNARVLKLQTDVIIEQEDKINFLNNRVAAYWSQYTTQRNLLWIAVFAALFFIVFLLFLFNAYRSKNRLNRELERVSQQLEEATHTKLVFFTNISHEFRTPLTLISGPISSLLADKTINAEQHRLLSLMQKNVRVLLKLIDQIIDFRKYENGKLYLELSTCNVREQFAEWNESFMEMAKKRHFRLDFNVLTEADYSMQVDIAKLERIYFNLLSNAFKFTPDKGVIRVSLDKVNREGVDNLVISVSNSGKGIPEKDINRIFDRFYQVDSHNAGSGIGLALVKAMVDLHKGQIYVDSEQDNLTTFTVILPFLPNADESQHTASANEKRALPESLEDEMLSSKPEIFDERRNGKELILVVDDSRDIVSYIKTVLQSNYAIIEANDGEEGFRKAVKHVPDLIISDVMMPKMDGIEFCRKIKDELSTSHIPVILLTACSLDEQRIIGFKSGTDDYIAKPFNFDVLEARVKNLIESRKRLRERFGETLLSGNTQETINAVDKTFLQKLIDLIEKNLSDSELNIEELGQSLGLSRAQLYRKAKSLTNYSPNELLRIIRLKKAYNILSNTDLSISEVTYDVGFTSPSYFAKCFKDYYNESPTDFLKRIR